VQIFNSVVQHFSVGIYDNPTTSGANLLVEDTIASNNQVAGIIVAPTGGDAKATVNKITANNNQYGVSTIVTTTIANSVLSNNSTAGLQNETGAAFLAKNVISGNGAGVLVGGTVFSYGDDYIKDNVTPVTGLGLTPVATQ
jgi:hypothetical protein